MNFLAHCLIPALATPTTHPDLIAGGFFGDFVKGPLDSQLPVTLALGIRLHRRLDAFAGEVPAIRASCERFPGGLRRFAPILVDIVGDHLLVQQWHRHGPVELTTFTRQAYAAIGAHGQRLPPAGQQFLAHAERHDLFAAYGDTATLAAAINSVSKRLRRPELAAPAISAIAANLDELAVDFACYFPQLVAHARDWLRTSTDPGGMADSVLAESAIPIAPATTPRDG